MKRTARVPDNWTSASAFAKRFSFRCFFCLAACWILITPPQAGQAQAIEWIRQFGTFTPQNDRASAVTSTSDGNAYVAGHVNGFLPGQSQVEGLDAYIRKYDSNGIEVWTRQFGTTFVDQPLGVAADASALYVAGWTEGVFAGGASAGGRDAFVRKCDLNGNEVWTRQFGTSSSDAVTSISMDASGIYVGGLTDGALAGGGGSAGGTDAFVRKYDLSGNVVWTRQFGTSTTDDVISIAVDVSGVYIVGETLGALPGGVNTGSFDGFVRKYDLNGNEVWTREFGSSALDDAMGVSVDPSGVYIAGLTAGALAGGGGSAGNQDAYVRKYDLNGNEVWTRQFGSSNPDQALSIAANASGVYVTGQTAGALPEGGGYAGSLDAFVRKYDLNGNAVWTRQIGTSSVDQALAISVGVSEVYVAGLTQGVLSAGGAGGQDAFVRKYDLNGNEIWTRQFGSTTAGGDVGNAVDSDGNIYVTGSVSGALPAQTVLGSDDVYVRKYDRDGNEIWTRQFGGENPDQAFGVSADSSGVYVAGLTLGTVPGGGGSAGGFDAFVRKYDSDGAEMWTRQFGTSGSDQVLAVSVDPSGVYVAGSTSGVLPGGSAGAAFVRKYDLNGNAIWTRQFGSSTGDQASAIKADISGVYVAGVTVTFQPPPTPSLQDAFVRKYDVNGNVVWTRQFGSSAADQARAVTVDASGVYVAGSTFGAFPGGAGSAGGFDAFVRKYDLNGNEVWTRQFGTSSSDQALSAAVDASGVYLAGSTSGAMPGGGGSAGGQDAFVRKYDSSGSEVWTRQFGSTATDSANGIAADACGVSVVGQTTGILGSAGFGSTDAFVLHLTSNISPVIGAGSSLVTVNEGLLASNAGTYADPNACDAVTLTASVGVVTVTGTNSGSWNWSFGTSDGPVQSQIVTITANDGKGGTSSVQFNLVVNNVPSTITLMTGPSLPLAVGATASIIVRFTDAGTADTHTCRLTWDDGTTTPPSLPAATVNETNGSGSCSATHTYSAAGVFTVGATVTDKDGVAESKSFEFVVVYDRDAGFVTGGGWIDSPAGAYAPAPNLTGKANFAFVSNYQQGNAAPTGQTEFQFAGLNFHSDAYEWLVVSGAKAQYKGRGTVNGVAGFGFMVTATSGRLSAPRGPDKIRIKIWDQATNAVVYDNTGGPDDMDSATPQSISGGSIVVHKDSDH
jgi:hypothetical protein